MAAYAQGSKEGELHPDFRGHSGLSLRCMGITGGSLEVPNPAIGPERGNRVAGHVSSLAGPPMGCSQRTLAGDLDAEPVS